MALSLVAGPTNIVPHDPLEVGETLLVAACVGVWIDGAGLLVLSMSGSTRVGYLYLVQTNGAAVRVSGRIGYLNGLGWSSEDDLLAIGASSTAGWGKFAFPTTAPAIPWQLRSVGNSFAVMPDRVLVFTGAAIYTAPWGGEGPVSDLEYAFASPGSYGTGMIAYAGQVGGNEYWWCMDSDTGSVKRYNASYRVEEGHRTGFGSGFRVAAYSVKHGLFFVVRRESGADHLYVYANEPVAASVETPTVTPSLKKGAPATLSARVLGDLSEPCAGRNVGFAVDRGAVDPAVVATDATGTARTSYWAAVSTTSVLATATLEE